MVTKDTQKITIVRRIIRTCFSKEELSYLSKILKYIMYINIIKPSKYSKKNLYI